MKIQPKSKILLVSKNEGTELSQDIYVVSNDDDKNLLTCTIIEWGENFKTWSIVITGKYSLYKLVYKGEDYYFLDEEDIVWTIIE